MAATLSGLPDDDLYRIFRFLGNPQDFVRLERTCTNFRRILSDDVKIWRYCPGALTGTGNSHRERSLNSFVWAEAVENIRRVQRTNSSAPPSSDLASSNVLLKTLGVKGFRDFLEAMNNESSYGTKFVLRGDSLGLLSEFVQDSLTTKLEHAHLIVLRANGKHNKPNADPVIEKLDIRCGQEISGRPRIHLRSSFRSQFLNELEFDLWCNKLFPKEKMREVIRNLGYRAGVAMIDQEAMDYLWKEMAELLATLVSMAVGSLDHSVSPRAIPDDTDVNLYADQPPFRLVCEEPCRSVEMTITPFAIAHAAEHLNLAPVLGDTWVAEPGKTIADEKDEAILCYRIKPDPSLCGEDDNELSEDDSESQYEDETSEDEFSEYDDEDCLDMKRVKEKKNKKKKENNGVDHNQNGEEEKKDDNTDGCLGAGKREREEVEHSEEPAAKKK